MEVPGLRRGRIDYEERVMRKADAREIRRGIVIANRVMRRERVRPSLTPFGFSGAPAMPLWERAYHHTIDQAVRSGKLRPPQGPSGIGGDHG